MELALAAHAGLAGQPSSFRVALADSLFGSQPAYGTFLRLIEITRGLRAPAKVLEPGRIVSVPCNTLGIRWLQSQMVRVGDSARLGKFR